MCSSPNIPAPPPPPQAAKMPDSTRRKSRNPFLANGTLLTGPGGVAPGSSNTGGSTLLGG